MVKLGEVRIKMKDIPYAREIALDVFADERPNYTAFRAHKLRDSGRDVIYGVYAVKKKRTWGY
jgi:hypothetical protein